MDAFCDENGNINKGFPRTNWLNTFEEKDGITNVTNTNTFSKPEDMKRILEMGFEEGYKMALNQLGELLGS